MTDLEYLEAVVQPPTEGAEVKRKAMVVTRVTQSCTGIPSLRDSHGIPPGVRVRAITEKIGNEHKNVYTCIPCLEAFMKTRSGDGQQT